jgi:uncharacterized membrane protein YgcG
MTTTSDTLEFATYNQCGLVNIQEKCTFKECSHSRDYTESTPMLVDDDDDDSSDDSFGGGSSSGGGAGSDW